MFVSYFFNEPNYRTIRIDRWCRWTQKIIVSSIFLDFESNLSSENRLTKYLNTKLRGLRSEGVNAILVRKDNKPNENPPQIEHVACRFTNFEGVFKHFLPNV